MVAGLDRAMGDFVFEFDDTYMDYPLEVLDRMYDSAVNGFDVVAAAPDTLGGACASSTRSATGSRGSSRRSATSGCGCRRAAPSTRCSTSGSGSGTAGPLPLHRVPVPALDYPADRSAGHRPRTSLRFGLDVFFSFTDAGVRIARALFLFFAAVAAVAIVLGIIAFISDRETPWQLIITSIIAVAFAGVFFILAVLGEYVARILAEVRSRPIYTMDKTLTWTITPTETDRAATTIPGQERVEVEQDSEPFMVRQRRESAAYLEETRRERTEPDGPTSAVSSS
jgi:dolichol-phosphate mannosyltransferase